MKNKLFIYFGTVIVLIFGLDLVSCKSKTQRQSVDQNAEVLDTLLTLNKHCPPGFRLNEKNECISQNLYSQYDSPNSQGVGGLKIALPEARDGFSPQKIDLGTCFLTQCYLATAKCLVQAVIILPRGSVMV